MGQLLEFYLLKNSFHLGWIQSGDCIRGTDMIKKMLINPGSNYKSRIQTIQQTHLQQDLSKGKQLHGLEDLLKKVLITGIIFQMR